MKVPHGLAAEDRPARLPVSPGNIICQYGHGLITRP
jgi:hypothetical protein